MRDMDATPFASILADLVARVPGAYASALVDGEGETVDYTGLADPFDVKVAAAHLRIVMHQLDGLAVLGAARWLVVRGAKKSVVARLMPESYAVVLLLRRRAGFTASRRAFAACERALASEAGWQLEPGAPAWFPVEVDTDRRGRPRWLGALRTPLEVLGAIVGLPARERGFRVRTSTGRELTLVREARNCWYADEAPDEPAATENKRASALPGQA